VVGHEDATPGARFGRRAGDLDVAKIHAHHAGEEHAKRALDRTFEVRGGLHDNTSVYIE